MSQVVGEKPFVMVVEDEMDLREIIVHFLKSEFNVEVLEAENGQKAKMILDEMPHITVVISDYNMPKMNGGVLFQHLKSSNHPAKFILISAMAPHEAPEFQSVHPDGYAEKPNFFQALRNQMQQFLLN